MSFDDWLLVDRLQVPKDLEEGDYVLGFRWDCEQSPQVWQQCASIRIVAAESPPPAPQLAPLCGDAAHGCCLREGGGGCAEWSGVSTCTLTREHCENGTAKVGRANHIEGCGGEWMPSAVAPAERCTDAQNRHVCGFGCVNATEQLACASYAAAGACTSSEQACVACRGTWLPDAGQHVVRT